MKKQSFIHRSLMFLFSFFLIFLTSCEPLVTRFSEIEEGITVVKKEKVYAPTPDSTIRIMTWNIRFGIGRGPWFGDACGYKVSYTENEVDSCLQMIVDRINEIKPDIILLQEVDLFSHRSGYVDQVNWLLENTYFNYASYGHQWKTQYVPSDGLGRLEEVNCVLSRWPITKTTRHQLALRTDQMAIERYFYERCSMVTSRVEIPGFAPLYVVNIHASAFATDDSKHQHLIAFRKQMEALDIQNDIFVSGGDLNEIPPGSDKTDFCLEDKCEDESYHNPGDVPFHRDGNNYEPEQHWLDSIYKEFESAVPLTSYQQNQTANFTHTPIPNHTWERTLDYLLTNSRWKTEQTIVHQNFTEESDHCPVSGVLVLKKK